ncbi:MAG: uroporphyrinogen decarboxylase family protein [Eubacteriales bacterium]
MTQLTSRERFLRAIKRQEVDRIPLYDSAWAGTVERWHREGMPANVTWQKFFGFDIRHAYMLENSPLYETTVLEETETYKIQKTKWGATLKFFKHQDSTPQFLEYYITSPERWEEAKARMKATPDRIDWDYLKSAYPTWERNGEYRQLNLWFGFDVTHSWSTGLENVLIGMYEDPDWIRDMFDHYLSVQLELAEMILAAGYKFDGIHWPDDMGYKEKGFFSPDIYRELLKPYHKKATDWAHEHGMVVELHSCGYIEPLIPDLIDIGIDCLHPIEVKAGMDPVKIKQTYGRELAMRGGINALLWNHPDQLEAEVRRVIPILKEGSGYIYSTDHSIPNSASLADFKRITDLVVELGSYN